MPALGLQHGQSGPGPRTDLLRRQDPREPASTKDNKGNDSKGSKRKSKKKAESPTGQDPTDDDNNSSDNTADPSRQEEDGTGILNTSGFPAAETLDATTFTVIAPPPPTPTIQAATAVPTVSELEALSVQITPSPSPTLGVSGAIEQPLEHRPEVHVCTAGEAACRAATTPGSKGNARATGSTASPIIGPLVGGLLGGLVLLAIVAVVTLFFLRRRRKSRLAPSAQYMSTKGSINAASFRRLPSDYSGSRSTTPSLGTRSRSESLRGASPTNQIGKEGAP